MSTGNYKLRSVLASILTRDEMPDPVVMEVAEKALPKLGGRAAVRLEEAVTDYRKAYDMAADKAAKADESAKVRLPTKRAS